MEWHDLPFFTEHRDVEMFNLVQKDRQSGIRVLPDDDKIYNALAFTPLLSVKVVILGQDPYPNAQHAMGLSFSIPETCHDIPMSLRNIFKELHSDVGVTKPNGSLVGWAHQGVLLLNACLTLQEGRSNSHQGKGWEKLTKEMIATINTTKQHVVFILWGGFAQKLGKDIDPTRHCIIKSVHPSPLSAHSGFFGSKPFSQTNTYLRTHGLAEIDWSR